MDADTGKFYFIEVNPRIQVEHTVTEQVTGIDIVKAQIHILDGFAIGTPESGVPPQEDIRLNGHALQCRITTEDPEQNFIPDYGRITAYRGATGFGIRLDGGTAYSGAVITRFYDPLLEKVTAWAPTPAEAIARMHRALREFRIRGVATNLTFLEAIISHPSFTDNTYTTKFIDTTPELFQQVKRQDRATKLLNYLADVTRQRPSRRHAAGRSPSPDAAAPVVPVSQRHDPDGTKQKLDALGPKKFAEWMRAQKQVLVTDTTMRDGHQSLLATRMRTHDIARIAGTYARALPQLLSLECWGGATFDVAMRFLTEDPWERLALVREAAPNLLLQMLLRGANGVGYTNYPDNVVQHFVRQAAAGGVDLFRVFDCLNWVENMRVAMDAVGAENKLCEAAICYTGDILDPARAKYDLKYYVALAKELEAAGAHIIAVKDMAGLLKPGAARVLFKALREATDLPIHFHTHDTSGLSAATVLAAVESGVDAIDAAMDCVLRQHLAALPRLDRRGAARHRARPRPRPGMDPPHLVLLGSGAQPVCRLRERPQGAGFGSLSARDAGRPVHQPQGAGALARAGDALARGGAGLSRRQPDVRRHRQGDAVVQGRRRHGADDGEPGSDRRRCREPGQGHRLPGLGGVDAARRSRPVARRLAGGAAEEGAEGRQADHGAAGFAAQAGRSARPAQGDRGRSSSARSANSNSPPR